MLPPSQFCYDPLKEESSNVYVEDQFFKSSSFPIYNLLHITDVNYLSITKLWNLKAKRNPRDHLSQVPPSKHAETEALSERWEVPCPRLHSMARAKTSFMSVFFPPHGLLVLELRFPFCK